MLIKLMKYDLKYMLRSLLPLYLVMIVLGVLAGAFFPGEGAIEERIYGSGNVSVTAGSGFAVIATAAIIAVTVIAIAVAIVTAMSVIHRFNRNLLGNEGYLSFTLPVTVPEHFFSKAFSSMIVVILGYAAGAVTFLLMGAIYTVRVGDAASVHEFWRLSRDIFSDVFYYDGPAGIIVLMILAAVVSIYQLIAQVFCASAIGSQGKKRLHGRAGLYRACNCRSGGHRPYRPFGIRHRAADKFHARWDHYAGGKRGPELRICRGIQRRDHLAAEKQAEPAVILRRPAQRTDSRN